MHVMRYDETDAAGWERWACTAARCGRVIMLNGRYIPTGYHVIIEGDPNYSHTGGKPGQPQIMGMRLEPPRIWTDADVTEMAMLGIVLPME